MNQQHATTTGALAGDRVVATSGQERPGPEDLPDEGAFLAKPFLPETVITVVRQMATPQVVEMSSSQFA